MYATQIHSRGDTGGRGLQGGDFARTFGMFRVLGGAFHDGDLEQASVVGGNATVFGDGGTGGRTGAADGGRAACHALRVPAG